jgi:plasmid maintenance system antidote protein VapI
MRPHGLNQNRLARDIDVSPAGIDDIGHGRAAVTARSLAMSINGGPQYEWVAKIGV